MLMLKQSFVSLSLICMLFSSNTNAAGIPTVDVASIAQSIKNYAQMVKQYNQMVKDTLNFEKQMNEVGVNMNSVNEILGNTLGLVRDMQNLYDSIASIPDDVLKDIAKVQNACSFLEGKSSYFKSKMNQLNTIQRKVNRCSIAISNTADINKTIDELTKKANKVTDYNEYQKLMQEIENIKTANEFLQQKQNEENANRVIAFYDTYKGNTNNAYSQKKHNSDLKELSKALTKSNNQKQAQALTNSLLLKLLESNQRQYELNLEFYKTMTAYKMQEHQSNLSENSYQKTYKKPNYNNSKFLNYQYQDTQFKTDSLGFPIITLDSIK